MRNKGKKEEKMLKMVRGKGRLPTCYR